MQIRRKLSCFRFGSRFEAGVNWDLSFLVNFPNAVTCSVCPFDVRQLTLREWALLRARHRNVKIAEAGASAVLLLFENRRNARPAKSPRFA